MKHTVAIPVMGGVHELKGIVAQIEKTCIDEHELLIINNSVDEGQRNEWHKFIHQFLKPQNLKYIDNQGNLGMVKTLEQIHRKSSGEFISILHSDLFIYNYGWDRAVVELFESNSDIGLIGFFGQKGMHPNGGREDCMSNMIEAEIHGRRSRQVEYIVTVDGFSICCRKEALDDIGGFDQDYQYHHFYDKSIGMDMLANGWKCAYLPVAVHHWSGITANNAEYQNWITQQIQKEGMTGDQTTFHINMELFNKKWAHCLPVHVDVNGVPSREITKNTI